MEEKVKAIRISVILTIISLTLAIIVEFLCCGHTKNILFTIFSGLFASALLSLIIYTTEYSVIRKKTLEGYWQCAYELNKKVAAIKVLYYADPIEEVKDRVSAIWNDYEQSKWLKADFDSTEIQKEKNDTYEKIEDYKTTAIDVMKSYINLADAPIQLLDNAYGEICFLKGKKEKTMLYNNIHKPLRNTYSKVKEKAYRHFVPYLQGHHSNLVAMIGIIENLQEEIFDEEISDKKEMNGMVSLVYRNQISDALDDAIEIFRAEVIYNEYPELEKNKIPSLCMIRHGKGPE